MKQLIHATIISAFLLISFIPQTAQASKQPVDPSGSVTGVNQPLLAENKIKPSVKQEELTPVEKSKGEKDSKAAKTNHSGGGIYISLGGIIIILLILIIIF
ncbi:MAG: hypothetical protein WCU83_00345 [Bacteroidia bacterium]